MLIQQTSQDTFEVNQIQLHNFLSTVSFVINLFPCLWKDFAVLADIFSGHIKDRTVKVCIAHIISLLKLQFQFCAKVSEFRFLPKSSLKKFPILSHRIQRPYHTVISCLYFSPVNLEVSISYLCKRKKFLKFFSFKKSVFQRLKFKSVIEKSLKTFLCLIFCIKVESTH